MTCSTGKSPFQIVNGYLPRTPIDLVPLPSHMRVFEPVEKFAKHIHDLHAEIRQKISLSNEEYKLMTPQPGIPCQERVLQI